MNLHLLASVDQTLLLGRDAFLLLDTLLYALDLFCVKARVSDRASHQKSEGVEARLQCSRGRQSRCPAELRLALLFLAALAVVASLRSARDGQAVVPCSRTRCPARSLCRSGCGLCGLVSWLFAWMRWALVLAVLLT